MKRYINQVLGDSLRCILPSYWWKRLLGKMADKIEFAEKSAQSASRTAMLIASEFSSKQDTLYSGSNIKTINGKSVLGSGNLSISTEKIEKYSTIDELKANGSTAGGDLAAVVDAALVEKSFSECYQPTSSEISNSKYDVKYTKIEGITVNPDFSPSLILENYGELSIVLYSDGESKGYYTTYPSRLVIRCDYTRYIYCFEYDEIAGTGHRLYDTSQGISNTAIERVNKILREGNFRFSYFEVTYKTDINDSGYRYYYSYDSDFPSSAYAMIDSFVKMIYAEPQNADVYVRSKEWEKFLKEKDAITNITDSLAEYVERYPLGNAYVLVDINGISHVCIVDTLGGLELDGVWHTYVEYNLGGNRYRRYYNAVNSFIFAFEEVISEAGSVGIEALSIYFPFGEETQLSTEQKNSNANTYSTLQSSNKKPIHFYVFVEAGTMWFPVCHYYQSKRQGEEAYFNIITYDFDDNSPFQKIRFKLYGDGSIEAVEYIKADSELSETSENPVQNKVVTAALNKKASIAYVDEKVANIAADSTFVIDLTVDEIEDAISNNGGVIDYTLNRELIIDALSKNIPMVVRIGEHSNGYCLAQGELDGADTLTITFSHSQYKYSLLIGENDIEVDRSSSISALEARIAALEAKLS